MSDFTSGFWSAYVAILTLVSIVACGALLYVMGRMRVKSSAKKAQGGDGVGTTGHVWDEDLAEYNNPLPRWWMWLFYITIAFGLAYLTLYPGLGQLPGILGWSSASAWAKERDDADAKMKPVYQKYLAMDVKAVAADPQALCAMSWMGCGRGQGVSESSRPGLALRRRAGDDQGEHHQRSQRHHAAARVRSRR